MIDRNRVRAVLLDLDGTLLDTAPDMARALNELRRLHELDGLPFAQIRPHVSAGALALVRLAFPAANEEHLRSLREQYIELYAARLAIETALFDGMEDVLSVLERAKITWGVVTNKPTRLAEPLIAQLGLHRRAGVLVCGDTLPLRKPDPSPLLLAARSVGIAPQACVYVGDARGDVMAARAAGMGMIVALYGYIPDDEKPRDWLADDWVSTPREILRCLPEGLQHGSAQGAPSA
jgi:2-phosphoglycolate phosphatase